MLGVPDVLDAKIVANDSGTPATILGVSVPAHSIYASVSGGDPDLVAKAIWTKKIPGAGYAGNTPVVVYDETYDPPIPYTVTFETPVSLPILFNVRIINGVTVPADAEALIEAAIFDVFADFAKIGGTIYASRFYSAVAALGSWVQIVEILIGDVTPTGTSVTADLDQVPTVTAGGITVTLV